MCTGIHTLGEFGKYHQQFLNISGFLGTNRDMDVKEKSHLFIQGFQPNLWDRITWRREIAIPLHVQGDTYAVEEVSDMAQYVLFGTSTEVCPCSAQSTMAPPTPLATSSASLTIKIEPTPFNINTWVQARAKALMPQGSAQSRPPGAPHCENSNATR